MFAGLFLRLRPELDQPACDADSHSGRDLCKSFRRSVSWLIISPRHSEAGARYLETLAREPRAK